MNALLTNLHPVMAAALAPFIRPARRSTPLETYHYTLCGVDLECEIEWEKAERQTRDEEGYPAQAYLHTACVGDVNIYELLDDEQRGEIETSFLNQEQDE